MVACTINVKKSSKATNAKRANLVYSRASLPFGGSVTSPVSSLRVFLAVFFTLAVALDASAQSKDRESGSNELDAFMEKVLARREVNRQTLKQYILDEDEEFEILGPGRWPLHRTRRQFTWYMRDGIHVRSPLKFNGVTVNQEARDRYERDWLERERRRQREEAEKQRDKDKANKGDSSISVGPGGLDVSTPGIPAEPRFVSEAYFMDFKFEPGNYYLAGREPLEGKEVLKIEYYPTHMFDDDEKNDNGGEQKKEPRTADERKKKEKEFEQQIERRMNKTALITLWVDPSEHQIVKYTFDNVWLDFLPAAWLVRVDDIRASMTMGQPFPGVWLPRAMNIHGGITLANGSFEAGYSRTFSEYREADVKSRLKVPKAARLPPQSFPAPLDRAVDVEPSGSGPWVEEEQPQETIREIRVHGNAFLTDDDVIKLAGVSVGSPVQPADVDAISKRLKDSGRFDTVEVRKRYRSLSDSSDVALVLLVHERPGVHDIDDGPSVVFNPIRRVKSRLMFLPILTYADGYGFTYGGRVSTVGLLGIGERLSVPLTWGGVRRAALEFERPFKSGPLTRVESSVAIWNRENPRFNIRDQRFEIRGRAERVFADLIRVGVEGSRSTIAFADIDDRLTTIGTNVALDTRGDPAFPSNAVYLSTGWTGMNFRLLPERVHRYTSEARGYLRVYRQNVLAARAIYVTADSTLPPYERLLLGGSSMVRGFRTGAFDGDRVLVTSAEWRMPVTSVLNGAKLGVTAFVDAGQIWNAGESRTGAVWHRGVGGGLFLIASIVRINLDVAHGLKTGDTRVHLSSGFTF
jgi:hypothetical protein